LGCGTAGSSCMTNAECCCNDCSASTCAPQCGSAADCPGNSNDCRTRSCTNGVCGFTYAPNGTVTSSQVHGDCRRNVCDGAGNIISISDNNDLPADDGNPCTFAPLCVLGSPYVGPEPPGSPCSQNGGTVCDGAGSCVVPNACAGSLVISQIYAAGGQPGATYRNSFIELHNRGNMAIDIDGGSIQHGSVGADWRATGVFFPDYVG